MCTRASVKFPPYRPRLARTGAWRPLFWLRFFPTISAVPVVSAAEHICASVAELHAAFKTARLGDVFLMRDGTWEDADIVLEATGQPDQPITLRAATPGQVVLTGRSRVRFAGQWIVVDGLRFERCRGTALTDIVEFRTGSSRKQGYATHSRLTNCAFVDCSPPDNKTNTRYVSLFGSDNRVDHCYLAGKTNLGPSLVVWLEAGPVRHRIDHNHFGPRPELGFNGGETIRVGDSVTSQINARCDIESNLFTGCDGEVEIISNKSCENIYRHNTFRECAGTLTLRHGHRNLVDGNFFFGEHKPMSGGVRIINRDQTVVNNYFVDLEGEGPFAALCLMNGIPDSPAAGYDQVMRARVAFNTVVNCRQSFVIGYKSPTRAEPILSPRDCTFANNLVVSRSGPLVRVTTAPTGSAWLGNLLHGAEPGVPDSVGVTVSDPMLVVAPDGVWRPGPASPARGASAGGFEFVSTDIDGQPRPAKSDVGCDQHSSAPVAHRPLAAGDVGPSWRKSAGADR